MSVCTCSFSFKNYHFSKKDLVLKFTACIHSRKDIQASSDNSEQTSNTLKRTMISPTTVCFVYFALLFGMIHANSTDSNNTSTPVSKPTNNSELTNPTEATTPTSTKRQTTNSSVKTATTSACIEAITKELPKEGHCIFFLPTDGKNLQLIVAALTVGCLVLLLTTLICACQVCHLRGIISSLQPHCDKSDRHAVREKSESPYRDEGHPTETCLMLSEVTTQEERREDEENKTEEKKDAEQLSTEPPLKDPNGDVTQENNPEPDAKAPESSDTGV